MGKIYGYCRVSSKDQKLDRQLLSMSQHHVHPDNIFIDKVSGANFKRPGWCDMVKILRSGDTIVVKSIDRLGRNYKEIIEQWRILTKEKSVSIVVLDMPALDTRRETDLTGTLIADIVLQLMSYVAQTERAFAKQRQAEGIAAARARGVHLGKHKFPAPINIGEYYELWQQGKMPIDRVAINHNVSWHTAKRWLLEFGSGVQKNG